MTDELTDTLREIVARLESCGIAYMLVDSVAALAYGHNRSTRDFDLVIEVRAAALRKFVRSLPEERFYVAEGAAMEALEHETLFNVLDMDSGWKVDLIPRKKRLDLAHIERWVDELGLRELWSAVQMGHFG